eukprot:4634290-Pyramimonas_sp.AAC.1
MPQAAPQDSPRRIMAFERRRRRQVDTDPLDTWNDRLTFCRQLVLPKAYMHTLIYMYVYTDRDDRRKQRTMSSISRSSP